MIIKLEFEITPTELAQFLQKLAEQSGSHTNGANSKVNVGEKIVAVLKTSEPEGK